MTKLNSVIHRKLLAQAEEAREKKMTKLAECIESSIGQEAAEESEEYPYTQLREDIHLDLWKSAARLMAYYDMESADAEKVNEAIVHLASKVLDELESTLGVDSIVIGPLEPKVPGENK